MRVLLDACVLFPTVMREVLLGAAATGAFAPLWSPRILEEWARAAARVGPEAEIVARAEIALAGVAFPKASFTPEPTADLHLPDPDDIHVLAAAIAGGADWLATRNHKDFPSRVLSGHGIVRIDPDALLMDLLTEGHDLAAVAREVQARAVSASGRDQPLRALLKRAGMPRLGKALGGVG
ncbi:MAG: PIN domain-containing protein [Pseudomonadota bacterium]